MPSRPETPDRGPSHALDQAARAFAGAARLEAPHERRLALRESAEALHAALDAGPSVSALRALPRVSGPMPTRLVFGNALETHLPFVLVRHRTLLVQYFANGQPQTLLWNPTDVARALGVAALDVLRRGIGRAVSAVSLTVHPSVDAQLGSMGLAAERVDVIAFDLLDGQNPPGTLARFPRARLAVTREEWTRYEHPAPRDRAFLVSGPEIDPKRVDVVTDARVLGDGVVLVRTGGRNEGHQALVLKTAQGVLVASGNTVVLDGYAPQLSRLPGLADHARRLGHAFVGAFPMLGDAQDAMAIENTLASRMAEAPVVPFVLPTIEMIPWALAPGLNPMAVAPELSFGTIAKGSRRR